MCKASKRKPPKPIKEFIADAIESDKYKVEISQNEFNDTKGLLQKGCINAYNRVLQHLEKLEKHND